jgi:hypothetical protein
MPNGVDRRLPSKEERDVFAVVSSVSDNDSVIRRKDSRAVRLYDHFSSR